MFSKTQQAQLQQLGYRTLGQSTMINSDGATIADHTNGYSYSANGYGEVFGDFNVLLIYLQSA